MTDNAIIKQQLAEAVLAAMGDSDRQALVSQAVNQISKSAEESVDKKAQLGAGFNQAVRQVVYETSLTMLRQNKSIHNEVQEIVKGIIGPSDVGGEPATTGKRHSWHTVKGPDGKLMPHLSATTSNEVLGRLQVHLGGVAQWDSQKERWNIITVTVIE